MITRTQLLRLANYETFIHHYTNLAPCYVAPHAILTELEERVCKSVLPESDILIPYCNNADCHFRFNRIAHDGCDTYFVYDFITTIA